VSWNYAINITGLPESSDWIVSRWVVGFSAILGDSWNFTLDEETESEQEGLTRSPTGTRRSSSLPRRLRASPFPLMVYNLTTVNTDVWNLRIYGSGTTDEISVPYSDIVSDKYLSVQDGEFVILNRFNFTYTFFYSGAEHLGHPGGQRYRSREYATQLRFIASDNYKSEFIPLSLVRDNPIPRDHRLRGKRADLENSRKAETAHYDL